MKAFSKILIVLLLFNIFSSCVYSEEDKNSSVWGNDTDVFNSGFTGQTPVTDNKLNQAIKYLKERSLTKKQKKLQEQVKPLSPLSDEEHLKNFAQEQDEDNQLSQSHTVMIPIQAYSDDGLNIPPGYYKLSCRKLAKDEYVLDLSQGTKLILSVKAKQTKQDLEQDSISFCNAEIIDASRIRLVYGSIDLNLVGYLYFK